ncbi:PmeII family type II restriction endonuclease [Puerhibacterium puerhi]|uniref:PmeII family type II restriction endonuclease n=1 Tax=Puerhibacterium puerhi TaxID=2692623 RepID=UPI001357D8C6|nr:PmeII family type II restriction endonuclease [Puerhibacterium puerhi]
MSETVIEQPSHPLDDSQSTEVAAPPASPEEVELVERTVVARNVLTDNMPDEKFEGMVNVTLELIERRFRKMQELVDVSSSDVNINPFLMLAMAPAYNLYSPFEVAEYTQNAKMFHGDATAFGKYVEKHIFELFGVKEPPEKRQLKSEWSPIDAEITVEGERYLTTWKSGPWTMNQSHANEMIQRFPNIHKATGCNIILGIFYGKHDSLNNKPALVARETGEYFHVLVGKDLWEFVTGVRNAHMEVYRAIREAQSRFAIAHGGKTFFEHFIEARLKLSQSFRDEFELMGTEDDMWEMIFRKAF